MKKYERDSGPPVLGANLGIPLFQYISALCDVGSRHQCYGLHMQRPFVLVTMEGKELTPVAQKFFDYITSPDAAAIIAKAGAVAAN